MWQRIVASFLVFFMTTSSFAAAICDFGRMVPWMDGRIPDAGATEYRNLSPFEIAVLKGDGNLDFCTFTASPYETLVVPYGFDTTADFRGQHPQSLSWVNVSGRSYPVMKQYRLAVHEQQQMFSAPPPVSRSIYPSQQQAPTYQSQQVFNDQPTMNVASSCDTSCKVLWGLGILTVGYLVFHKNKNNDDDDNNRRGPGGPVNPSPAGLSVQF